MCPGEDCYLFIGKRFQNGTLEFSTSGQGPLCKIAQYTYAVSEVRTQCPPGALYSLRTYNKTHWGFTATTEVRPGLLLYMVLLKRMTTMHERFKSKKLFPSELQGRSSSLSTACLGLHRKLYVWKIILLCPSESNYINTGKKGRWGRGGSEKKKSKKFFLIFRCFEIFFLLQKTNF